MTKREEYQQEVDKWRANIINCQQPHIQTLIEGAINNLLIYHKALVLEDEEQRLLDIEYYKNNR